MRSFIRVNHKIRVPQVRCLDADGNMLGILPVSEAMKLAVQSELDLVEVSPNAEPPVCRIMNFGKYRYEENRKERVARKNRHALAMKEIKFHANVEEHDYETKLNSIRKFLDKGHKVKITLFFRGRENVHRELGFQVINRVVKDCGDIGIIDMAPKLIGRGIFGILSPAIGKPAKPAGATSAKAAVPAVPAVPAAPAAPEGLVKIEIDRQPSVE